MIDCPNIIETALLQRLEIETDKRWESGSTSLASSSYCLCNGVPIEARNLKHRFNNWLLNWCIVFDRIWKAVAVPFLWLVRTRSAVIILKSTEKRGSSPSAITGWLSHCWGPFEAIGAGGFVEWWDASPDQPEACGEWDARRELTWRMECGTALTTPETAGAVVLYHKKEDSHKPWQTVQHPSSEIRNNTRFSLTNSSLLSFSKTNNKCNIPKCLLLVHHTVHLQIAQVLHMEDYHTTWKVIDQVQSNCWIQNQLAWCSCCCQKAGFQLSDHGGQPSCYGSSWQQLESAGIFFLTPFPSSSHSPPGDLEQENSCVVDWQH